MQLNEWLNKEKQQQQQQRVYQCCVIQSNETIIGLVIQYKPQKCAET